MRFNEILNENDNAAELSNSAHMTRRFAFMQIKNRRFMFNPKTGKFILGNEGTASGKGLDASHAEEYFDVTGSNHGYDDWIKGWVGVGGRYKNGVIHFSPPLRGDGPKADAAFQCIQAFVRNGANGKTKIRGLTTDKFHFSDEPTVDQLMGSLTEDEILDEMPISNFQRVGNWDKNSSFKEPERKLLTNPKAVTKITNKWARVPQHFNMYFVNSPEANRHSEVGVVTPEWLEENMPKAAQEINIDHDAVNIIFNSNKGDEKVPMTAWIIAHRFGHAISRYGYKNGALQRQVFHFTEIRNVIFRYMNAMSKFYGTDIPDREDKHRVGYGEHAYAAKQRKDNFMKYFFQEIGTMKSARDKNIRNEFEFTLELLAQYMLTGRLTFNRPPKSFKAGRSDWYGFRGSEHDYEYCENMLQDMAEELEDYFNGAINEVIGKILVM